MSYEKVEIGQLVALRQGFAINKKTNHHISDEPTNLHLLRIGDMKDGKFSIFVKDTIPEKFIAKESDIIFTRTGQVGLVFRKQYGVVHNNCFTVTTIDEDILLQEFIYYALQEKSFYEEAISRATGAAQPDLPHGAFNSIQIYLPPIESQRKITNILNAYDILIENNQKQIKLLEEAAQRLYKEWFVDLHFPGYEDVKIVDGVPEGWKRTSIGEYLMVRSGYAFKSAWWQNTGYPVVKIKDIVNNTIDISGLDYVAPEHTDKSLEFRLSKGDVVIAMTGATIGKIGLIPDVENLYTNQRVGKVFPNKELTNPTPFVFCFYAQKSVLEQIVAISSSSSAQPNISGGQLESFEITANTEIINEFGRRSQPYFDKINCLYKKICKLEQARDRLLPKLMNGELEV